MGETGFVFWFLKVPIHSTVPVSTFSPPAPQQHFLILIIRDVPDQQMSQGIEYLCIISSPWRGFLLLEIFIHIVFNFLTLLAIIFKNCYLRLMFPLRCCNGSGGCEDLPHPTLKQKFFILHFSPLLMETQFEFSLSHTLTRFALV